MQKLSAGAVPPLLAEMALTTQPDGKAEAPAAQGSELVRKLEEASPEERQELLFAHVLGLVAKTLGIKSSEAIDPRQPLNELGLDSLMAVELRNALGQSLARTLPASLLFDYPDVDHLVKYLLEKELAFTTGAPPASQVQPDGAERKTLLTEIKQLSEEEVEASIEQELASLLR
jgi:acyl carrier protein